MMKTLEKLYLRKSENPCKALIFLVVSFRHFENFLKKNILSHILCFKESPKNAIFIFKMP